ncbi:MAG: glycosyltransferase family 2 protein [Lachnospiraceae bacterium]|nr:glycosyltransferase family 2 protein [Lachnospiraceae bacterium]
MIKENSKVSVIIPVYNGEKYIKETLNSVLQSIYQNLEVLIINDGSTDNSREICERYQQKDSRIVIYDQKNCGVVSARNNGVSKATGDYLCFCDQDDIVDPMCYVKQIERMQQDKSDLCMCSVGRSIDGKYSAFEVSEDACYEGMDILEQLLYPLLFNGFAPLIQMGEKNRYPHIWSCMFRANFWKTHQIQFRKYVHFEDDLLVKTQALASAARVSTIAHIGYYWRVNLNSETYAHVFIENIAEKQQKCYEDLCQSIVDRIGDEKILQMFQYATYCKQYLEAIHNLISLDRKKTWSNIRAYYDSNIYARNFEESISAAKYVKKGKIKPQILLWLLLRKQTILSYYAEFILDKVLLLTLHSQTLTKIERKLKGIRG